MGLEPGNKLSKELCTYIKIYTNVDDLRNACDETGYSMELLRYILSRNRVLTESNIPLAHNIIRRAIKNRNDIKPLLNLAHKEAVQITEENKVHN